ncbi:hypothetical protein BU23DRAFT_123672 [Bimuria novae-zelandiae CBS 107.79]|uniref:Uncharacterized protein n=1 Tax=Bimuria novae-zelandiae CBS 107.79 TaxID=1447943 RepID=A0A6A5VK39_9PLEO|nr:hypothetical protein BU23DRAFT_123672 [Bimuria novae-zelandiae CBS 107.79]
MAGQARNHRAVADWRVWYQFVYCSGAGRSVRWLAWWDKSRQCRESRVKGNEFSEV